MNHWGTRRPSRRWWIFSTSISRNVRTVKTARPACHIVEPQRWSVGKLSPINCSQQKFTWCSQHLSSRPSHTVISTLPLEIGSFSAGRFAVFPVQSLHQHLFRTRGGHVVHDPWASPNLEAQGLRNKICCHFSKDGMFRWTICRGKSRFFGKFQPQHFGALEGIFF